jgi:hypothetical protein
MLKTFRILAVALVAAVSLGADVQVYAIDALQPPSVGVGVAGLGATGLDVLQASSSAGDPLLFDADFSTNGPRLSGNVIPVASYSASMTLAFSCILDDLSGTSLSCATSSGTTAFTSVSAPALRPAPFLDETRGAQFVRASDNDNLVAGSSAVGNITTGSFVLSASFYGSSTAEAVIGKKGGTTTEAGWLLGCTTSTCVPRFYIGDGTTGVTVDCPNNVAAGRLTHVVIFYRPDDAAGLQCFGNGDPGTAVSTVGLGSLSSADVLALSAQNAVGALDSDARIFSVKLWTGAAATVLTAESVAVATRMAASVFGTVADTAKGSSDPTAWNRSTIAFTDKINTTFNTRRLFSTSTRVMRLARRRNAAGTEYATGILKEPPSTNLALRSQDFDNAAWTKVNASGSISANTSMALDDNTTADGVVGNAVDGGNGLTQAVTLTATTYTLSVFAAAGTHSFLYLSDDTVANATGYVNLATCAAGTAGAGASISVDAWPYDNDFDGDADVAWCRASITFTGTVASHTLRIEAADADGDHSTTGNGVSVMITLWGAQVEAQLFATSPIQTTASSVTRTADDLRYSATGNALASSGSLVVSAMRLSHDAPTDAEYFATIGSSGSAANKVHIASGAGDACRAVVTDNSGVDTASIDGTTDVSNGASHTCRATWSTNDVKLFVDGVGEGTPDTSAAMPASFANIFIGSARTSTLQANGLIRRVRIYSRPIPGSASAP